MARLSFFPSLLVLALVACTPTRTAPAAEPSTPPSRSAAPRARDLGVPFEGRPGQYNAITDVAGVRVGHTTL
ncbi:MAG: hypothetical protein ACOC1F_08810, partial [Myxococcota bacterium]